MSADAVVDLCASSPSPARADGGVVVGCASARGTAARARRKGGRPTRASVGRDGGGTPDSREIEVRIARLRAEVDDIRSELERTGGGGEGRGEAETRGDATAEARTKTERAKATAVTVEKVSGVKKLKTLHGRKVTRPRRGCGEPEKREAAELDAAEAEALVPADPLHDVLGCSKCRWALAGCALCRKHSLSDRSRCPPLRERAGFQAYARRFGYIVPALSRAATTRNRFDEVDFKVNPVMTLDHAMAGALVVTSMKKTKGRSPFDGVEIDRFIFPDGTRGVRFFLKKQDEKPSLAIIGAEAKTKDGHYNYFKVSTFQAGAPLGRCTTLSGVEAWLRRHVSGAAVLANHRWHHSKKGEIHAKRPSDAPPREASAKKQKLWKV